MGIRASVAISMTCLPGAKDSMDVASLLIDTEFHSQAIDKGIRYRALCQEAVVALCQHWAPWIHGVGCRTNKAVTSKAIQEEKE